MDTQPPAIPSTIGDAETAAANLTLSGTSSDHALVRNADIIFGGSGTNRSVTITPQAGRVGTADITISVSDGAAVATSTFQLSV